MVEDSWDNFIVQEYHCHSRFTPEPLRAPHPQLSRSLTKRSLNDIGVSPSCSIRWQSFSSTATSWIVSIPSSSAQMTSCTFTLMLPPPVGFSDQRVYST